MQEETICIQIACVFFTSSKSSFQTTVFEEGFSSWFLITRFFFSSFLLLLFLIWIFSPFWIWIHVYVTRICKHLVSSPYMHLFNLRKITNLCLLFSNIISKEESVDLFFHKVQYKRKFSFLLCIYITRIFNIIRTRQVFWR